MHAPTRLAWLRTPLLAVAAGGLGLVVAATATTLVLDRGAERDANAGPRVIYAEGADRRPSETAQDWVTYADYVVTVRAVAENEIPPAAIDLARGEGIILRDVTLKVDSIVWARPNPARAAPDEFHWTAFGWHFTDGDAGNRVEMAERGASRIELGHTYVMALEWEPARCDVGDRTPGRWRGLGDGAILPYDGATLGQGEVAGATQAPSTFAARAARVDAGLSAQVVGRGAAALRSPLRAAEAGVRKPKGAEYACP